MNGIDEFRHFVGKRLHISFKEEIKRLVGTVAVIIDIRNICRCVICCGSLTARTEHFKSLVVAVASLAAVVNNTDCTALEFECNKCRINISGFTDCRVNHNGGVCVNLFYLAADKTSHIKIMNRHIKEDTARNLNIFNCRRFRVTGCNFNCLKIAEFALVCETLDFGKIMVVSSVKADLKFYACFFNSSDNLFNLSNRQINRLFAENMLACLCRFNRNIGVCIR